MLRTNDISTVIVTHNTSCSKFSSHDVIYLCKSEWVVPTTLMMNYNIRPNEKKKLLLFHSNVRQVLIFVIKCIRRVMKTWFYITCTSRVTVGAGTIKTPNYFMASSKVLFIFVRNVMMMKFPARSSSISIVLGLICNLFTILISKGAVAQILFTLSTPKRKKYRYLSLCQSDVIVGFYTYQKFIWKKHINMWESFK